MSRKKGVQNYVRRTGELENFQVRIPAELKARFAEATYPRPMVSVVVEMMTQYLNRVEAEKDGEK